MAQLADLPLAHRLFVEAYRFRSVDWRPGSRLAAPLGESKIALISSAGLHLPSQPPFNLRQKGGDCSFREIPTEANIWDLKISHRSSDFDQSGANQDRNLVFPLDRMQDLAERREIGGLTRRHFSVMGSVTAPEALICETAPQIAQTLKADGAGAALLIPT